LIERGAQVRVVDNLSSGRLENLRGHLEAGRVEFSQDDLLNPGVADRAAQGMEYVFHLAADHGGCGYVDLHQAACATNLALDDIVFHAARKAGVYKVVFASSGCVSEFPAIGHSSGTISHRGHGEAAA
jgi:nucleoside-diphosphate-sugar epimerase